MSIFESHCVIGLSTNEGIKAVELYHDGYISHTGVLLNMFYRDVNKVAKLISRGDIMGLGLKEDCPNIPFKNTADLDICHYSNLHYKTSFTRHALNGKHPRSFKYFEEMMLDFGLKYAFIYDASTLGPEKGSKWLVVTARSGQIKDKVIVTCTQMDKLIKSVIPLSSSMKWAGSSEKDAEDEWVNIQDKISYFKKLSSEKDIDICNDWLQRLQENKLLIWRECERNLIVNPNICYKVKEIEFGYRNTQTEGRKYAIYQKLQQGQGRRKCIYSTKDLNELLLFVCNFCGINEYARPIFINKL